MNTKIVLFALVLSACAGSVNAQDIEAGRAVDSSVRAHQVAWQPVQYTDIIVAKDSTLSQEALYSIVLEWLGKEFVSAKTVLDMQDKSAGVIIAKARQPYYFKAYVGQEESALKYALIVHCKQGKVKLDISNIKIDNVNIPLDDLTNAPRYSNGKRMGDKVIERIWSGGQNAADLLHTTALASLTAQINQKRADW